MACDKLLSKTITVKNVVLCYNTQDGFTCIEAVFAFDCLSFHVSEKNFEAEKLLIRCLGKLVARRRVENNCNPRATESLGF